MNGFILLRCPRLVMTAVFLLSTSARSQEVEIVHDGAARACILVAADAHPLEQQAAQDLQWAVQRAARVKLPITAASPDTDRLIPIRIGHAATKAADQAMEHLPYDAAVVNVDAQGIDIKGPTPAGTANGVATVLLEDIGVRMYYPDELFAIVPRSKTITIRPRVAKPSFDYRVWSGIVGSQAAAYQRRNRLSPRNIPVPYFGFGHNLGRIIPVEKYGETHPEYFAFRNGARRPEGGGVGHATQPCFTNPDVIRLTIEAARTFFDQHPDKNTFSLCVNDNPKYCECGSCAALDKPYRDLPVGRQYSESYFDYVSEVAEAIAESHPDKYLGVYAYWNVEQPPRNRDTLPPNVIVALTLDILQHYDPAYRTKDNALVKAWSAYVNRLHTYVYYGLGWYTPRTSPRLVAEDLRFASQNGVRAIYCEAYPFWAWCGPMLYVASRLQWDVDADVETILQQFHTDCFGDAAEEMRRFHDTCERYWTRPRPARWFEGLDRLQPEAAMADIELLRQADAHLQTAATRADSALVRRRIAWIRKGFDFTMAIAEAIEADRAETTPQQRLTALVAAADHVDAAHRRLADDPAYKHTYYQPGPRFDRKCWGWLQARIQAAAQACHQALREKLPEDRVDRQWQSIARSSGLAELLEQRQWDLKLSDPKP